VRAATVCILSFFGEEEIKIKKMVGILTRGGLKSPKSLSLRQDQLDSSG
jgi:hypothetical protein